MHKETKKKRIDSGNSSYHTAKDKFFPHFLSKNMNNRNITSNSFSRFLYGFETLSLKLKGSYGFEVLEKRTVGTRLESKREEVIATLTELCNKKHLNLYYTRNII